MAKSIQKISVIVPKNPFVPKEHAERKHCLCALDVLDLMRWWPGKPHFPKVYANKVREIQRSLDWKRVAQIASYLLQEEIYEVPTLIDKYFNDIYEPRKNEPGREWPPIINKTIGYEPSEYRVFSNILVHINGAKIEPKELDGQEGAGELVFDENDPKVSFSIIDGQHRINGAYLALKILREREPSLSWQLPVEAFLDLDPLGEAPRLQAQIFIDVNFYQKKVDRSLVADLFPTARGQRGSLSNKERAQDIGRKLMLETGPLVGMIQIPGIKYGYKDVITLATLNSTIEDELNILISVGIDSLEGQTAFLAQCLSAWLEASGRFESLKKGNKKELSPLNVAYQGRILVSVLNLIPAMIWKLKSNEIPLISTKAVEDLTEFLKSIISNAGLLEKGVFIEKEKFKKHKILGSGGIALFRELLWAAIMGSKVRGLTPKTISELAEKNKSSVYEMIKPSKSNDKN